jgi:hypothetical protein
MQNPMKQERRSTNRAEGNESTGLLLKLETMLQTEKAKPEMKTSCETENRE